MAVYETILEANRLLFPFVKHTRDYKKSRLRAFIAWFSVTIIAIVLTGYFSGNWAMILPVIFFSGMVILVGA